MTSSSSIPTACPARTNSSIRSTTERVRRASSAVNRYCEKRFEGAVRSDRNDRQFVDPDGVPGTYQQFHQVYNREGQACFQCRQPILRETVRGRSTFYCPKCQS